MADKAKAEKVLVSQDEEDRIKRNLLIWLNGNCPYIPGDLKEGLILYERLLEHGPCMAMSTMPGTYIVEQNIIGGYEAVYQFSLVYRVDPQTWSSDQALSADETLGRIGDWVRANRPDLGEKIEALSIEMLTRAYLLDVYESGEEDHMISFSLRYKVSPF